MTRRVTTVFANRLSTAGNSSCAIIPILLSVLQRVNQLSRKKTRSLLKKVKESGIPGIQSREETILLGSMTTGDESLIGSEWNRIAPS
jgi:hypothetical protein